jgi:hypothetical protein
MPTPQDNVDTDGFSPMPRRKQKATEERIIKEGVLDDSDGKSLSTKGSRNFFAVSKRRIKNDEKCLELHGHMS